MNYSAGIDTGRGPVRLPPILAVDRNQDGREHDQDENESGEDPSAHARQCSELLHAPTSP